MELSEQILEVRPQLGPTKRRSRNHSPDQAENVPTTQKNPAVQFVNMTKKFGSFTAVDELNLNLHKDEIFCFLGHNGAGKTTSLNVLMGKEKPSKGAVLLNLEDEQYDVHDETSKAQQAMGCCTQHDILFESLTVEQHITLFFKLKIGFEDDGSKTITQRVDELIKVVSLQKHRHVES
jgi:ATP-binding cassette subfamily A (ABC1) protein 3